MQSYPEWANSFVDTMGDAFGALLWECIHHAEMFYVTASLPQIETLERMYGNSQQKVVMGLVHEAARRAGLDVRTRVERVTSDLPPQMRDTDKHLMVEDINMQELLRKIMEACE